jgi:two-component system response regulator DevR
MSENRRHPIALNAYNKIRRCPISILLGSDYYKINKKRKVAMKRIYIVDDSVKLRKRLCELLSDVDNVQVVGQAGDAGQALDDIRFLKPDTVLLDIRLPGKNGIQLLGEVKALQSEITVIIMTNYDYPQYRQQSIRAGADYFFNKTREFENIIDVLKK